MRYENILNNRIELGFLPTPIQKLENLSKLYPEYNIYIKRDDHTGLATGGNKTRKLEYLLKEALDKNCDTVITAGASQSNHCRQTAAACSVAGLNSFLLLGGEEPEEYTGNLLLSKLLGAKIVFTGEHRKGEDIPLFKKKIESDGKKCFIVPYGGSNLTGALGFVNAVKELKFQIEKIDLKIDYIFFASSSGGTQAGLTLGVEMFDVNARLIPVNIDKEELEGLTLEESVLEILKEGVEKFGLKKTYELSGIFVDRSYDKAGYGVVTQREREAIKSLAEYEGILLDPVYTARAFGGMSDYLKNVKLKTGSNVLFWHTGGIPAIFSKNILP